MARHTSEMERRADEAERELLQWKKVRFMADKVGDEFEGYVTGVAAFGLFIAARRAFRRRAGSRVEHGRRLLPVRRSAHSLRGENTQKVYRLGDKVKVQVIRVDMDVRQIDLGSGGNSGAVRPRRRAGAAQTKARPKREQRAGGVSAQRPGAVSGEAEGTEALGLAVAVFHFVFEVLDALADAAHEVGQPVRAEDHDHDGQDDEKFRQADASHDVAPCLGWWQPIAGNRSLYR